VGSNPTPSAKKPEPSQLNWDFLTVDPHSTHVSNYVSVLATRYMPAHVAAFREAHEVAATESNRLVCAKSVVYGERLKSEFGGRGGPRIVGTPGYCPSPRADLPKDSVEKFYKILRITSPGGQDAALSRLKHGFESRRERQ
jgi:hypothetical protein